MTAQPRRLASPIPQDQPIPHRKIIRLWLAGLRGRSTALAVALMALDYALFALALAGVVLCEGWVLKLLCGLAAGFVIGRLFILGHDACHQSLTPHRGLNRWLGRLAFLPSLTPYSLWEVGHNIVHHGYTNLKGVDFVWAPLTRDEYAALTPLQRGLQRIYRSGWAPGLYYLIEIWWKRMYFPAREQMGARRAVFVLDGLLVTGFALAWLAALVAAAVWTAQPIGQLLLAGFVAPFAFWCAMIGFVVYVHHTHKQVAWHADKLSWGQAQPFVSTTVHLTFPAGIGALFHHIMEHTAHHVDMGIPLYHLKAAQALLEKMLPERIVVQPFSWRWYFETARRCKLYNFEAQCWTDFAGRPTGPCLAG